jgi:enterobactin synthetase component D
LSFLHSPFESHVSFSVKTSQDLFNESLYIEEEEILSNSLSEKRKIQFTLGRLAARDALQKSGFTAPFPLMKGSDGEVIWPSGYIGSVSHTGEIAVAAVTRKDISLGLGIDIEPSLHSRDIKIFDRILVERERAWVHKGTNQTEICYRGLRIFSAKEACFKAFFAATSLKLGYKDAVFSWIDGSSTFKGTLQKDTKMFPQGFTFTCVSLLDKGYMLSGITLPIAP